MPKPRSNKPDHQSYLRLVKALSTVKGVPIKLPSEVAKALGVSDQTANNWRTRKTGVSVEGAFDAQKKFGINAAYILADEKPMMTADRSQPARLDESILSDAIKVLSGAAQWEGQPERQPAPREIALAYSLIAAAKETVDERNLIAMVRKYLSEREKKLSNEPA